MVVTEHSVVVMAVFTVRCQMVFIDCGVSGEIGVDCAIVFNNSYCDMRIEVK